MKIRPQAVEEIDEIAAYIAQDNIDAAIRFYFSVQDAFDKLGAMPGMGTTRRVLRAELRGLRSWPIKGFGNYLIFYMPLLEGGIEVIHVLHGARNVDQIIDR